MPSPTFNGSNIFDSTDDQGGTFSEGCLSMGSYTKIRQTLHFNGEMGDRYLFHGYGDRTWEYKGILSAATISDLNTLIKGIESYIDQCNESTYFAMTDSFGRAWTSAQITAFDYTPPRAAATTNTVTGRHYTSYCCDIVVRGTVVGQQQEA